MTDDEFADYVYDAGRAAGCTCGPSINITCLDGTQRATVTHSDHCELFHAAVRQRARWN